MTGLDHNLRCIGLAEQLAPLPKRPRNDTVARCFAAPYPALGDGELLELYEYCIPKPTKGGACSLDPTPAPEPYRLSTAFGLAHDPAGLRDHPHTERLWRLNAVVDAIARDLGLDWIGIYRSVERDDGSRVLLKEAYRGACSRAEFPLTEDFAEQSNNTSVWLSGRAVVVADVRSYSGPYYECSAAVLSEFCCPILAPDDKVIGLLDAESTELRFFTPERVLTLATIAYDLGCLGLGLGSSPALKG